MIIKTLVENTAASEEFGSEHGLSLYIETCKHKFLFDVGASDLFLKNAVKLGVHIPDIDYLIISHGHYDHGGGLKTFLKHNAKAEVFVHEQAFDNHYALRQNGKAENISLDSELKEHGRIVLTSDRFFIGMGVQLFTNTLKQEPMPASNAGLSTGTGGSLQEDDFGHEQNLVIEENGKTLLVTGCAHSGIINIVEQLRGYKGRAPDYVIGGFHLSSRASPEESIENDAAIKKIGMYLAETNTKYYTGHCTGIKPYQMLKSIMGDKIEYISAGVQFKI